ncbi:hypothetical protein GECvBMG_gp125 [Salmonella phage GEC_vB_MG]|uniref:Uncharacterized protein 113 n=1 Tax=Salmonella phage PVPSE1 TaxID=889338 RepID=G3BLX8_9CAUD|nr:nucleotide pyrophosphohydrolase [Salmonella phage PVPSE1]ADP02508.1 conserved hypothetical protein [Salmonella phage PVPSE1]QPI14669.1 hypothetical protein GECvBMG_gp125 [Salmonella phage GEC_vB_MG]WAK43603.1 hypothetical protein EspYZU15_103 [Cronobacter phage EspYZU15]WNT48149.1 nucleotide pyrophosphohydrolase [Salmonella phage SPLA5a]
MNFGVTYETLLSMTKPKDMVEYGRHVAQWNHIARVARGGKATPVDLQFSFVVEEFKELMKALSEGDRVEVVDGACDLFVVSSYALWLLESSGVRWEKCLKPAEGAQFNIGEMVELIFNTPLSVESVAAILQQSVALCFRLDINLDYNMRQVLSSNDSKYPTMTQLREAHPTLSLYSDDELLTAECKAIEKRSNGRYSSVNAVRSGENIVFFDGKGKIMKPSTFVEPKIIA